MTSPKRAFTWIGVAFVVFFLLSSPADPGGAIRSAYQGIESAANQLATFVKSIA